MDNSTKVSINTYLPNASQFEQPNASKATGTKTAARAWWTHRHEPFHQPPPNAGGTLFQIPVPSNTAEERQLPNDNSFLDIGILYTS